MTLLFSGLSAHPAAAQGNAKPPTVKSFTPNHLFVGGIRSATGLGAIFEFDEVGTIVDVIDLVGYSFGELGGVAVGPDGNLYVSDRWSNRVLIVRPDGTKAIFAQASGWLYSASSMSFGPNGDLYVAVPWNQEIVKLNRAGFYSGGVSTWWYGDQPSGFRFLPDGAILLGSNGSLVQYTPGGARIEAQYGDYQLGWEPGSPAIAPDGSIAVPDYYNYRISVFAADGSFRSSHSKPFSYYGPRSVAFGSDRYLYSAIPDENEVQVFDSDFGFAYAINYPEMMYPTTLVFAPWRLRASLKGTLITDGSEDVKASDATATLSYSPGSNQVMLALEDGGAMASQLGSEWHVFHGFESADVDGKKRSFHGTEVSGMLGNIRNASINLEIKGKTDEYGVFTVKSAKGTLHFSEVGRQLVQVKVSASKVLN